MVQTYFLCPVLVVENPCQDDLFSSFSVRVHIIWDNPEIDPLGKKVFLFGATRWTDYFDQSQKAKLLIRQIKIDFKCVA